MRSDSLMIPSRNLPFGMMLTPIFKHYNVDLTGETSIVLAVNFDSTLLKRMYTATVHASHAQAPPSQPAQHHQLV